jgi:hypothetical protein
MPTPDRIVVSAHPCELHRDDDGGVDVFAALSRQFFWADTVILTPDGVDDGREDEVLEGEVVG